MENQPKTSRRNNKNDKYCHKPEFCQHDNKRIQYQETSQQNVYSQNNIQPYNNQYYMNNNFQSYNGPHPQMGYYYNIPHGNNPNFCMIYGFNPFGIYSVEIPKPIVTQNEGEYYCKYCQMGICDKREKDYLDIIHRKLTWEEKEEFLKVWHWRLAINDNYEKGYKKARNDLAENKFIKDSKTRSKFSLSKDKKYGLVAIVIDVILKGKLCILNPFLVYMFKDETTNENYYLSWCKCCVGASNNQCPSFKNLNEDFEPSIKDHDLGIQMTLPVTLTENGYLIHSPLNITTSTCKLKKIANPNLAKEYIVDHSSEKFEQDKRDFPLAKFFPEEILNIHMNITKPKIQKIYNDKLKGSL